MVALHGKISYITFIFFFKSVIVFLGAIIKCTKVLRKQPLVDCIFFRIIHAFLSNEDQLLTNELLNFFPFHCELLNFHFVTEYN